MCPRPSRSSWARVRSSTSQSSPIAANTSSPASPAASAFSASRTGATPSTSATVRSASNGKRLRQVAERPVDGHRSRGGPVFAGDQLQQRALACAVGRHQAGAAVADGEGQLLEQRRVAGPGEGQIRTDDGGIGHVRALRDCAERDDSIDPGVTRGCRQLTCIQGRRRVKRLNTAAACRWPR